MDRNDPGNWRLTIQDGNRFAIRDGAQVFAQSKLELGDAYILHNRIMTRNGYVWQVFACESAAGTILASSSLGHSQDVF
jgi:hypothetical protein